MTVINTNYSTIEEAWGGVGSAVKSLSKKKKKTEPLCDLYEKKSQKSRKPYMDEQVDPYEYHGEVFGPYDKVKFSRTTKPKPNECARVQRERKKFKPVVIDKTEEEFNAADEPEFEDDDSYFEKAVRTTDDDDDIASNVSYPQQSPAVAAKTTSPVEVLGQRERIFDFGLYIASGIMLIIIMEQILQLGMRMRY